MKKNILLFAGLIAIAASCQKESSVVEETIGTLNVSVESIVSPSSKVVLNEGNESFDFTFEGQEIFGVFVAQASDGNFKQWQFTNGDSSKPLIGQIPSWSGNTAYFLALSKWNSGDQYGAGCSNQNVARVSILPTQNYSPSSIYCNAMLMGRSEVSSSMPSSIELKILNSFLKFRVKKGSPTEGADAYSNGMKLKTIVVESVGDEVIAGRFDYSKTAADWISTRTPKDSHKSITLNCGNTALNGSTYTDFVVALPCNTYAQGLKVTFTILDENDNEASIVKYIGKSGVTLDRKTLYPIAIELYPKVVNGGGDEGGNTGGGSTGGSLGATYTWTIASGDFGANGNPSASVTKGTPSMTWRASYSWPSGASKYLGWSSEKGIQVGSGSATNKCNSLTLTASSYSGSVSKVVVNGSIASSGNTTVAVKVGDTNLKCLNNNTASLTTSAAEYVFTSSEAISGNIQVIFTNSVAKAFYVKSISINPAQ